MPDGFEACPLRMVRASVQARPICLDQSSISALSVLAAFMPGKTLARLECLEELILDVVCGKEGGIVAGSGLDVKAVMEVFGKWMILRWW